MSNIRDGGYIVIGVEQAGDAFAPVGMNQEDYDSFTQDYVSAHINNYADPFAEVTVTKAQHEGRPFVTIQVAEFAEIPVLCKRDGLRLRQGAMYTRSRRMNESVEVPTSAEMRDIMEAAVEKGFRRMLATLRRAGVQVAEVAEVEGERFDKELEGL
jgi:predicted HTH transcriptional regulator